MSVLRFKDPTTNEWKEIITIAGPAGKDGEPGAPGKDGETPVKGVDYFDGKDGVDGKDYVLTEEDKADIALLAIELMPVAEEGAY